MHWTRVMVAVACVVGCVGCVGCGSGSSAPGNAPSPATADTPGPATAASGTASPGLVGAGQASAGQASAGQASAGPLAAPWPARGILPENNSTLYSSQVLDLATGMLYVMVAASPTSFRLEAVDLRTGRVRHGKSYPFVALALASGYLWLYGTSGRHGHPVLDEVDPGTLVIIRSIPLPAVSAPDGVTAVAAGPAGSVWASLDSTLLRVSASTGAVLARANPPGGLDVTDLALGPGGMNMYASAEVGSAGGAVVLEYSAGTGRLLARGDGGPLTGAISGAWLTAVPGGIWVSFRTGMMGESGLLSARSLTVVSGFVTSRSAATGAGTVYSWAMGAPAAYAGGALWVETDGGVVACVNPATGRVRAEETAAALQGGVDALAADGKARQVAAVIGDPEGFSGVVTISPPSSCWG